MQPLLLTGILLSAIAQQTICIANSQKSNIRLRLRIVYSTFIGTKVDEIAEFNRFLQDFGEIS
ncbi:31538_t:CDS:2, partial [Gigaspora margarita]